MLSIYPNSYHIRASLSNKNSCPVIFVQIKMRPISTVEIHCSEKPVWTDRGWRPLCWRHEEDPLPLSDWTYGLLWRIGSGAEEEPRREGAGTRYCAVASPWQPPGHCSALQRRCIQGCFSSFSYFVVIIFKKMVCLESLSPYCWRMIKRRFLE